MKVTATLIAYLSPYATVTPDQLATEKAVAEMVFSHGASEYLQREGYTHVGSAIVEVDLFDTKEILAKKVEALREEIKTTRANSEAKVTKIEGQIQNLLAIEYSPEPELAGAA